MISLAIILLVAATLYNAFYDAQKIEEGKYINHKARVVVRGLFMGLQSWSLYLSSGVSIGAISKAIQFLNIQAFIFWILFDFALNKYRNLPLEYLGKTSKMDKLANETFEDLYEYSGYKVILACVVIIFLKLFLTNLLQWITQ